MDKLSHTADNLGRQLRDVVATDSLVALETITAVRGIVAEREREAVLAALVDHTWRDIGAALGVSKQAAFQRGC